MSSHYCYECGAELASGMIDGREREYCPQCGWVHYVNPLPVAAAVVLNERNELLLIRRGVEPRYGKWALPMGHIEEGESDAEAAIRELEEETGVVGEIEYLIKNFLRPNSANKRWYLLTMYKVKQIGGEIRAGSDALEARFFSLDSLPELPGATVEIVKMLQKL